MSSAKAEQIEATDVGLAKAVSVSNAQPYAQTMYPATQMPYHGAPSPANTHPETPAPIIGALSPETWNSPYTPPTAGGGQKELPISDVSYWGGHPDKSYYTFVVLSVLFGLLGVDHFYVRSFHTGIYKFIMNLCTFGMWYIWDILQIINNGEQIRKEGLTSPFDWFCGIAKGVFIPPGQTQAYTSQKSYLIYAFLAIFLGWFGLDKLYMGNVWQAVAKALSVFNPFLILFGVVWVLWDSVHALMMTKSLLTHGITAPLPYSFLFTAPISANAFMVNQPIGGEPTQTGGVQLDDLIPTIPVPVLSYKKTFQPFVAPIAERAVELLQPFATPAPVPVPIQSGGSVKSTPQWEGPGPAIAGVLAAVLLAGGLKGLYDFLQHRI